MPIGDVRIETLDCDCCDGGVPVPCSDCRDYIGTSCCIPRSLILVIDAPGECFGGVNIPLEFAGNVPFSDDTHWVLPAPMAMCGATLFNTSLRCIHNPVNPIALTLMSFFMGYFPCPPPTATLGCVYGPLNVQADLGDIRITSCRPFEAEGEIRFPAITDLNPATGDPNCPFCDFSALASLYSPNPLDVFTYPFTIVKAP